MKFIREGTETKTPEEKINDINKEIELINKLIEEGKIDSAFGKKSIKSRLSKIRRIKGQTPEGKLKKQLINLDKKNKKEGR